MVVLKCFYRVQGVGLLKAVLSPGQALEFPPPFPLADTDNPGQLYICRYDANFSFSFFFFSVIFYCQAIGTA